MTKQTETAAGETGVDKVLIVAFQERIRNLEAEIDEMRPVIDAAIEWRRVGYERKEEFSYRIGPLLDAIDIYDVGHKRPCEEL